jgi:large subunit ribosomal protein L21
MYAVLETGGKQFRVQVGETIDVEHIDVEPGQSVTLDQILMVGEGDNVKVGKPTVKDASVKATVVRHGLKRKEIIWHYMPKQRYRVKRGWRQSFTRLHIDEIKE